MSDENYRDYLRDEWQLFARDPKRTEESLKVARGLRLSRILDVGCGAGQEMLPFLTSGDVAGIGVDVSSESGLVGLSLFEQYAPAAIVKFCRARGEALPFLNESFDLVICRLALPYMNNSVALSEMARVLRAGGGLWLQIHHARYYVKKLTTGMFEFNIRSVVHAARVLATGLWYHSVGVQPSNRLTATGETFQTEWLLRKELRGHGLFIDKRIENENDLAPSFLIRKG
jgi:ubiquinone/menaquinone biosynthesis C-methylase UbiE